MSLTKIMSVSAAALVATSITASAGLVDFTEGLPGASSGTVDGVSWEVSGAPDTPAADRPGPGPVGPLAGDNDGFGITDDEVDHGETFTVTFSTGVNLATAYFLDLFFRDAPDAGRTESAIITSNWGGSVEIFADDERAEGVGFTSGPGLMGSIFTFTAGAEDDDGTTDFAVAGLQIAAVPLPAGMLLMGTALGGLGLMRRRKKA